MKICYLFSSSCQLRQQFIQSIPLEINLINELTEQYYDMIFFDEPMLSEYIESRNVTSIPVIYCMFDQNKPIKLIDNLYRIIIFSPFKAKNLFGLPTELYLNFWPYSNENQRDLNNNTKTKRVLHISSHNDSSLYSTRCLIKIFNQLSQFQLIIYYTGIPEELQCLCNPNIQIEKFSFYDEVKWNEFDVVTGSDDVAVQAILEQLPVIIVGQKGIGGMVTPENINTFMRFCFEGRNGGEIFEYIPEKLLSCELEKLNTIDLQYITNENRNKLKDYLSNLNAAESLSNEIHRIIDLHLRLSSSQYENIFPALAANIRIIGSGEHYYPVNHFFDSMLGELDTETNEWLKRMNGIASIQELISDFDDDEKLDSIEFITELWNKKIIILSSRAL